MKISLHQTGEFRAAFTDTYFQKLLDDESRPETDRAFWVWDKGEVNDSTILQALDIHFPLNALSSDKKPVAEKGKTRFLMQPVESELTENDSVTTKFISHAISPDHKKFQSALEKRRLIPAFHTQLDSGEYFSIVYGYSKILPIEFKKEDSNRYGNMFLNMMKQSEKIVGDTISNQTLQIFEPSQPPSIINIGRVSILWESETNFSVNIDAD